VGRTSAGYGCQGELTIVLGEPPLVNDPALTTASWPWLGRAGFTVADFRSCGADDFSYYSQCAPALMLFTGTPDSVTLHHPRFLPPDAMVGEVASAMLAGYLAALTLPA
jgi:metal-dependent amidase/aminoacylase/carboxypeptidase family protein